MKTNIVYKTTIWDPKECEEMEVFFRLAAILVNNLEADESEGFLVKDDSRLRTEKTIKSGHGEIVIKSIKPEYSVTYGIDSLYLDGGWILSGLDESCELDDAEEITDPELIEKINKDIDVAIEQYAEKMEALSDEHC